MNEIILMAAIAIARGVGVVLKKIDRASYAFVLKSLFCGVYKVLQQTLSSLIVYNNVVDRVTFRCCVFGMRSDI